MPLFLIGIREVDKDRLYRIFDSTSRQHRDSMLYHIIESNLKLVNAEVKGNKLVGTTGSLDKMVNQEVFVVIGSFKEGGKDYYRIVNTQGKVVDLEEQNAIVYFTTRKLQNASVVEGKYIRGINWEIPTINSGKESVLFTEILKIVMYYKANCHKEIPLEVTPNREKSQILLKCRTVELYSRAYKCSEINSLITLKANELLIELFDVGKGKRTKNGEIKIPFKTPEEILHKFKSEAEILLGLCGYVRGDVAKAFISFRLLSKADFDAVDAYTNGSGHINRACRKMSYDEEKSGDNLSSTLREIHYLDDLLGNNQIVAPLTLFRGCPYDDFIRKLLGKPANNLEGCVLKDDAYFSTTINFQVTPNFATGRFKDREDVPGIIQVYKNNLGIYGRYIHDVAKWDEQYEILVDRRYDTVIQEKLFTLRLHGKTFYVYNCKFELHRDNTKYDLAGRVPFDKQYSEGMLHKVYDDLRRKGYNYITYYDGKDKSKDIPAMIIIPNEQKEGEVEFNDTGITYNINDVGIPELDVYKLVGNRDKVYVYRTDSIKGTKDTTTLWGYNVGELSSIRYRSSIRLQNSEPSTITRAIENHIKFLHEAILFSVLDLGRFFNEMFTSVLYKEGYDIFETFRVEYCGDTSGPQTGYVPLRFKINGDDDDSLMLNMKMYRDQDKKLVIEYSGQSLNKKVKNRNILSFSSFNTEVAEKNAQDILYTFASKLKLSCVRKMDNVALQLSHILKCGMTRQFKPETPRGVSYQFVKGNNYYGISAYKPFTDTYDCFVENKENTISLRSSEFTPGTRVENIVKELITLMKQLNNQDMNSNDIYKGVVQEIESYALYAGLDCQVVKDVTGIDDMGVLKISDNNRELCILTKFGVNSDKKFSIQVVFQENKENKSSKQYSLNEAMSRQVASSIFKDIHEKLGITPYKKLTSRLSKLDVLMNSYFTKLNSELQVENYKYSLDKWKFASMDVNGRRLELKINEEAMSILILDTTKGNKQSIPYTRKAIHEADDLIKTIVACVSRLAKK